MKTKHTPGPWRIDKRASSRIVAGEDDTVANVGCQSDLRDQWPANARLIAAAPELVAALEDALEFGTNMPPCVQAAARAALEKAGRGVEGGGE